MRMTGAEALLRALEREGTDVLFGLPGGAILPTYDPLIGSAMRHVLMRHEQGAGHAAEGYAHVTGRPGVCIATSGPGGTNLVTPLTDAMMDSVPLVAVTGQVARADMGRQAFQEAPITDIVRPVTKQTWLVMDPDEIPQAVHDAFRVAREGRPGSVLIDVPKDVQRADLEWYEPRPPAHEPSAPPDPHAVAEAARLLREARRPVLYVGGGVVRAGACDALLELALKQQLPVTTTLMARGAFPDSHPLALGMPGMHGSYAAVTAMQRADLLVAVGARFDDRVTGRLDGFAPGARVVHVDVDPREIGKNRAAEVGVLGDAREVLEALLEAVPRFEDVDDPSGRRSWLATLDGWKEQHPYAYRQQPGGALKPQLVVERLREATGGRAVLTAGVGQHQMWASQFWTFDRPLAWANSGGLGTMGFALPAALGAKAARPDELVIAVDGDGSFQMTVQELASSVAEDLPVLVAVVNNGVLGMVKQWQELFFSGHSHIHLRDDLPDFARLAESYGCVGLRASSAEEVDDVVSRALEAVRERTVVVDFRVDPAEMVFPMVPAGATNDGILLEPPGVPA
jgi:acetolactate synthase I/II/III large subunit